MKYILILVALLTGSTLTACATVPTEGTVTDLRLILAHEEQHSRDVYENYCAPMVGGDGKITLNCAMTRYDHTEHWTEPVPDCWRVTIADAEGNKNHTCAPHPDYLELHVGSHYKIEEE